VNHRQFIKGKYCSTSLFILIVVGNLIFCFIDCLQSFHNDLNLSFFGIFGEDMLIGISHA